MIFMTKYGGEVEVAMSVRRQLCTCRVRTKLHKLITAERVF